MARRRTAMTSPGQTAGIMLAPVTLRRTSPKLRATSATSSRPNAERCCDPTSIAWQSGVLHVVCALRLSDTHLTIAKCPGFEDVLEAKLFVVQLLRGLLCLRSSNSLVSLFWLTQFDLIPAPIGRLARLSGSACFQSISAMRPVRCRVGRNYSCSAAFWQRLHGRLWHASSASILARRSLLPLPAKDGMSGELLQPSLR